MSRCFLEDTLPLVSQVDGAQVLVVVNGGSGGVGSAAAAGGDDDSWRTVDAGGGGGGGLWAWDVSLLLMAVVGVGVGGGVICVVIKGGVAISAVEIADPTRRPPLIWAASHQADLGRSFGADGHSGHSCVLQLAEATGEEASLLHQALQLQFNQVGFQCFFPRASFSFCIFQRGAVTGAHP